MFLEFQKILLSNPAIKTRVIVNSEGLLTIDFDNFENNGIIANVTNIEVVGNPKYRFYTLTSVATLQSSLKIIDVTSGFIPGSSCIGGNTIDIIYPSSSYPFIILTEIFNNTITESRDRVINLNHILYVEEMIINDAVTQSQQTVLIIGMSDTIRSKVITTLSYADLSQILQPVQVT